ncbi:DUF2325 domain-containing protein [Stappia sp.]|uniref:DUF2325 domain-containing protein n=1 Tax=Stappia sp. TaxID=1870903 RepID=UPI003A9A40B4
MCARHEDLQRAIGEALEAHVAGGAPKPVDAAARDSAQKRRIAIWEQSDNVHCSIVGTCASVEDLRRLARKVGIDLAAETPDYDVHGHFVRLSTADNTFSRAFQKLLDQRFEGALRRVARARGADALAALWREMCERGQVAPAYWAFMTQAHVPASLRASVFGEVHMLSHLAGASFRQKTAEATTLRDQLHDSEERARRVEAGLKSALAERDREIAELRAALTGLRAEREMKASSQPEDAAPSDDTAALRKRLSKAERAIQTARARARLAEARLAEIDRETGETRPARPHPMAAREVAVSPTPGGGVSIIPLAAGAAEATAPRAVLYVGGMHGHRDRLRGIAEAFNATFVHHDGGVEDAPQRLDNLLPSVDCVFCPVNCVSHDACLRAKKICQKLNKPFVPLRSSGQSAFRKALQSLVAPSQRPQIATTHHDQGDPSTCTSR